MPPVKDIEYFDVRIPFTRTFKHGSAERDGTETLLVRLTDATGLTGYGEGCPRSYVTGESLTTVIAFIKAFQDQYRRLANLDDIRRFITTHHAAIDRNPAAWCGVETALLDLLARQQDTTVEKLLGRTGRRDEYVYTAVLGDSPAAVFHELFNNYYRLGYRDYKIKLCDDSGRDREKLAVMRDCAGAITVRADANNLWADAGSAITHLDALDFPFLALEEPVQSGSFPDLSRIAAETGMKIILDESLLNIKQVETLSAKPAGWIANARLSKYGGILRSLEMAAALAGAGIEIIAGAHVGETSLLTRAALILADAAGGLLRGQEGGFSTHLLQMDPFEPNLKIGRAGMIDESTLECRDYPGFGMQIVDGFDMYPETFRRIQI